MRAEWGQVRIGELLGPLHGELLAGPGERCDRSKPRTVYLPGSSLGTVPRSQLARRLGGCVSESTPFSLSASGFSKYDIKPSESEPPAPHPSSK